MEKINILYIDDEKNKHKEYGKKILEIVDNNKAITEATYQIHILILETENYKFFCCETPEYAYTLINEIFFDVVFIDYQLMNGTFGNIVGIEVSNRLREKYKKTPYLIMLTVHSDKILEALQTGVFLDYLQKSQLETPSDIITAFNRFNIFKEAEKRETAALKRATVAEQKVKEQKQTIAELQKDFNVDLSIYTDEESLLKGNSNEMKSVRWFIEKYAQTNLPVLLLGATGTGKELVAKEIHLKSNRHRQPFKPINCAAIPETLIESELFGYKKGSFTNANSNKDGFFKIVGSGTLFLDEFADMSTLAQVKVLRAIAEEEFYPLGSDKPEKFLGRVICATSQDFSILLEKEGFRVDLLHRVNSLFPKMPSLKERKEDIYDIVYLHLCDKFNQSANFPLAPDAIKALVNVEYGWPGNVRELLSFVDNILALFPNSKIDSTKILKLLEAWKSHQADIGITENMGQTKKNKVNNKSNDDTNQVQTLSLDEEYIKNEVKSELIEFERIYNNLINALPIGDRPPKIRQVSIAYRNDETKGKNYITERYTGKTIMKERRITVAKYYLNGEFSDFKIKKLAPFKNIIES